MKNIIATLFLTLMFTMNSFAGENLNGVEKMSKKETKLNYELIELNIVNNLNSPIIEIRANTIQLIIDLKRQKPDANLDYAVFPLMDALKGDASEAVRILSAIALFYLDSEVGNYALQRASKFDESKRVRRQCEILYNKISQ